MPPQDVVGRARPFLAHQVVDLEARQAAAERLAHVRRVTSRRPAAASRACRRPGPGAGPIRRRRGTGCRRLRAGASASTCPPPMSPPGSGAEPVHGAAQRAEVRLQLLERLLRKDAVGRELAADDRQRRREAGGRIEVERVVARHGRGAASSRRPASARMPAKLQTTSAGLDRPLEGAIHDVAQVLRFHRLDGGAVRARRTRARRSCRPA